MEQNIILSRKRITLNSSSNFGIFRANKLLVSPRQCFCWISGKIRKWIFLNEGMDFSKAGNGFPEIRECIFQNQGLDLLKSGNGFPEVRECFYQNQRIYFPKSGNVFPEMSVTFPRIREWISQKEGMHRSWIPAVWENQLWQQSEAPHPVWWETRLERHKISAISHHTTLCWILTPIITLFASLFLMSGVHIFRLGFNRLWFDFVGFLLWLASPFVSQVSWDCKSLTQETLCNAIMHPPSHLGF